MAKAKSKTNKKRTRIRVSGVGTVRMPMAFRTGLKKHSKKKRSR